MEASMALHAPTTQDIVPTITPQITKETTEPLIKEKTRSTTPQMHLAAGTTTLFQWT